MDPKKLLKILAVVLASFVLFAAILPAFAIEISEDPFVLIPEAEDGSSAKDFTKQLGEVKDSDFWMEYNSDALVLDTEKNAVGAQLKSGIISWNFIL
ncbi:MAG: hypothetical protein H6765_06865 [Candidatus Peribacteria bacterium]|nr:MAG: hypothetical protein H6765_06865 [Candidatus Peribacteria bacterium]